MILGTDAMITLEDCIALCGLSRAELDAIAEHEHLPESAAAALAAYLTAGRHRGVPEISAMIRDDIRNAVAGGNHAHAAELIAALRHLLADRGTGVPRPESEKLPGTGDS